MHGSDKQAYDRGTSVFSPDGRLYQVEYAREAVKRGSASVGVRTPEGVALVAERNVNSDLIEQHSIEKLHRVDNHIGAATAGHVADGRKLIETARKQAQINELRYGEPITVDALAKEITDYVQQFTQVGGRRPFGVSLLLGGVDEDGSPHLYESEPSGTPYEWKAAAIGGNRDEIHGYLEREYEDDLSLTEGMHLALEAISGGDAIDADSVGAAVVSAEDGEYRKLDSDEVESHLAELNLLAEGDSE